MAEIPYSSDFPRQASAIGWRRPGIFAWAALAVALLFSVPIVSVLSNVFVPSKGTWAHLVATVLPDYVVNTLWLAVGVGIGVLVVGVATAWLVTMCRFPGRRLLEWALILPLAVPAYVIAYTYTDFLQYVGPVQTLLREVTGWNAQDYWFPSIRSRGGAIAMLILVLYPYVYLLSRAAFLEQSVCALEASRTLGQGPWRSFFRVAVPLARPAIAAGVLLALMETLADFGAVSYFGVQTFTTGIYRAWFSMGDRVAAAQLSAALLGFVFLLVLFERGSRGHARYHHTSRRHQRLPGYRLTGFRAGLATLACALPVVFGFVLPAVILLHMALAKGDAQFGPRYLELVWNSFTLAGIAAATAVLLALLVGYGVRLRPSRITLLAARVAGMGYAVPGSIIAVGVLIPFAALDNAIDGWLRATFGVSSGLLLTGSIAALVFAYLVRFLAISLQTVDAGLTRITLSMDDAARTLGAGPGRALRRVHAPMMWGSLLTAALIVFVDVLKELPATLIMRPFGFDTLAVQAYNLAADERLREAATPALTIVAVSVLPLIILSRRIARSRPGGQN